MSKYTEVVMDAAKHYGEVRNAHNLVHVQVQRTANRSKATARRYSYSRRAIAVSCGRVLVKMEPVLASFTQR